MVLLPTSTLIGYYRHFFATTATPTVLWRPLILAAQRGEECDEAYGRLVADLVGLVLL
jgi:hypothetical protein